MKLVIDIPEKIVTAIQNGEDYRYDIHTAIAQGTHLPEVHGDLIDRDVAINEFEEACVYEGRLLKYIPTVIPADIGGEEE